ncbi:multiprotein-bridging factor 1 [Trichomonascus vanleenenianus]|uniref:multiprotein-bridging factor 1 n=1 Tax=Trichomonascus vanleenenianus TaxID=2268995 RepID=UPI003ECB0256
MSEDWDNVTYVGSRARGGGGGPRANVARTQGEINAARRSGNVVSVDKKYGAGGNRSQGTEGQRLTRVDRETDIVAPPKIDVSVGRAIQKGRQDKNLTQKDLATRVNEKPNVINDYEAGRATPNQQLLGKIERVIGVKLRGKDIGAPLGGPKKK